MALTQAIYEKLADEEDARICDDIPDRACRETPRSFVVLLVSFALTKLGDALLNPKTTLAWLVTTLGAPGVIIGLLVPIRESGSMIPQLFIGGIVRQLPRRKWVWVAGSIAQGLAVLAIGIVAIFLDGPRAGWLILLLVVMFSVARGFSSVASKDVIGKTIPKPRRGRLNGWSASVAGLISLLAGVLLLSGAGFADDRFTLGALILSAGLMWLAAALVFSTIREYRGETGGARSARDALGRLNLLINDKPFRLFVVTRALLMCSALSAPFYVALATERVGTSPYILGTFIVAGGLASLLSAPIWGRFADESSKRVMVAAAIITAMIGIAVFASATWFADLTATYWFLPTGFFVLATAHSGVRVGRKTYVVNLAGGNLRTDYVAISNTVIGVLLLVVGSLGALSGVVGNAGLIGILSLMGLAGAVLGTRLH